MAQNDDIINDLHAGIPPSGTTGSTGSGGTSTGAGYSSGGTGTGMSSGGGMTTGSGGTSSGTGGSSLNPGSGTNIGGGTASSETEEQFCTHCGQSLSKSGGIEGLLSSLRSQFENVDVDEYLNTAREYLKGSSNKVTTYTKDNPGKVAAGVAALAVGAGLIYAAVNRDKTDLSNATTTTTVDPPPGSGSRTYDPNRT